MPQVTTLAEARELVGRTFERDGERRTIVKFVVLAFGIDVITVYVGPRLASAFMNIDDFNEWLSGATEIKVPND